MEVHIKQCIKLASIKINSYKRLSKVSDFFVPGSQKYFMLNHNQGCLLHAALAIQTIIDNLQVCLMSQSWDNMASMHDHLLTVHAHKT